MVIEVAARRRIIRRPRLTSMLDESSARIRLLVAPAGYGKTTLAREWLGTPERNDAWYRGGPASADVAALAAGISDALGTLIPNAGSRMRERLRATGHAEEDVEILAGLLSEDIQNWPADTWLAIDDYHLAMESAASERFIELLSQSTPVQILIASRVRPSWATPRRILYGEIQEIERRTLAMRPDEAREIVGLDEPELVSFLERARGWPAVVGLVGLSSSNLDLKGAVPDRLYEFFAHELYESLPRPYRVPLGKISFASRFDHIFAERVLGSLAREVLASGLESGALSVSDQQFLDFHPLFADFLRDQAFETPAMRKEAAEEVGQVFIATEQWDEAVDLARRFDLPTLLVATMKKALYPLIDSGRLPTVRSWLETGSMLQVTSPVLDLAEAEVSFRVGDCRRAESMAEQAASQLGDASSLVSRAYFRAGHSALLGSREKVSISHFQRARETAGDAQDLREALFGLYSAMSELDLPDATKVLAELDGLNLDAPDDQLRAVSAKLTNALRVGGVEEALATTPSASVALERATNPIIITSFLHALSHASSTAGHYQQGLSSAKELLAHANEQRLVFVRPFGIIDRAVSHLGLRCFAEANHDIELVATLVPHDAYFQGNVAALRCRLLLATGRAAFAAKATEIGFFDEQPPAPLRSELLAFRALALACTVDEREPLAVLDRAETVSKNPPVVRVLAQVVRSICSTSKPKRDGHARKAWDAAAETGNLDTLVCAYRAYPDLLLGIASCADRDRLAGVLARANDGELAERFGIPILRGPTLGRASLTARETEVMDLVAAGLTNKEVAQTLFVTESTVKAHLRHAYAKLHVRGRSEAVPKWLTHS